MHANLTENWKQAAAEESVDYRAIESTFMTQAYGFVANKAKVLFRDPFRLGFEIVHRNEKATKMVGIFAFRCNKNLLYAPVFFVNGEVKGADMLYRSDVKRFIPLTDEWCSFLVRGANEEAGSARPRGENRRQSDSNMHRLAYPQRIKYANADGTPDEQYEEFAKSAADGALFREVMEHCIADEAPGKLLPKALAAGGPDSLVKLANLIEGSDIAQRYLAENYTTADLTLDPDWCVKKASAEAPDPIDAYRNSVVLVRNLGFAKSAADRKGIAERGYALEDYREAGAVNAVTTVIEDSSLHEVKSPGVVAILDVDAQPFDALLAVRDDTWMCDTRGGMQRIGECADYSRRSRALVTLGKKPSEFTTYRSGDSAIGNSKLDTAALDASLIKPSNAKVGKAYVLFHQDSMCVSDPFIIKSKSGRNCETTSLYGSNRSDLIYRPDSAEAYPEGGFINSEYSLIEIKTEEAYPNADANELSPVWEQNLMTTAQMNSWLRTSCGVVKSKDITITKEPSGLFTLSAEGSDGFHKVARHLDQLNLHLKMAGDFSMCCNAAGEMVDFAAKNGVHRSRSFDTVSKSASTTQMHPEQEWMTGYDPVLNVRINTPQQQNLGTYTPERPQQHHRIGDAYAGEAPTAEYDPEEDGLPGDALMSSSPEELAEMSQKYDMPHIFDHGVVGNLANNTYDTIEQVRQYIPDLETGVDRYARVLFLLRYRPADFEESYGKDELMEMEQELTSLFKMSGESLLRMLKRFDSAKFAPQSDS